MASKRAEKWWEAKLSSAQKAKTIPKGASDAAELAWSRAQPLMGAPDEVYGPTKSSNPSDPRIGSMEWYKLAKVVIIHWGDGGADYFFDGITPTIWNTWKSTDSPGRFVKSLEGSHIYGRI